MYPSVQATIWGNVGKVTELLDTVLDCFIKVLSLRAIMHLLYCSQSPIFRGIVETRTLRSNCHRLGLQWRAQPVSSPPQNVRWSGAPSVVQTLYPGCSRRYKARWWQFSRSVRVSTIPGKNGWLWDSSSLLSSHIVLSISYYVHATLSLFRPVPQEVWVLSKRKLWPILLLLWLQPMCRLFHARSLDD